MAELMNKRGVLDLAERLIAENPGNIRPKEEDIFKNHLADSYNNAEGVLFSVYQHYPELRSKLNFHEISLAAGLHDIGRVFKKDQLFHELRGAKYIQEKGLELGVADNLVEVYRIAQMFRSHFLVSEQFADETNKEQKKEFEPLDASLLIPRTWQEALVTYSELTNVNGKRISFENRIADIQERYVSGTEDYNLNPSLAIALEKGLSRVFEVCERVKKLRDGRISKEEIAQYGFL